MYDEEIDVMSESIKSKYTGLAQDIVVVAELDHDEDDIVTKLKQHEAQAPTIAFPMVSGWSLDVSTKLNFCRHGVLCRKRSCSKVPKTFSNTK